MGDLDLKNLSAEQDKVLREILEVCHYYCLSRNNNLSDNVYVEQAKVLGLTFKRLQELKMN